MRARTLVVVCAIASILALPGAQAAIPGCADPAAPGGEWRQAGGDVSGARNQTQNTALDAATVRDVAPAWVFDTAAAINGGGIQNTPTVADGCVFLSTATGWVFALNADDGKLVWNTKLNGSQAGSLQGGVITGSPAVENGLVYVAVSTYYKDATEGPRVVALHEDTGLVAWDSMVMDPAIAKPEYETTVISAPVVWNGVLFQGIMASEAESGARGGYAIFDAITGERLVQDWTITDEEYEHGYRGASIWCTAAVDVETGYAYACGGNPASKRIEARYSNALLKIDLDRTRATFGEIVDSYKGNPDNYYPGLERQPVCDMFGEDINVVWSLACLQLDLDFGASPNVFKAETADGHVVTLVGALQKSGIYHAVFADNMSHAWTSIVGLPAATFNASSAAVDGANVYVAGTPPSQVVALSNGRGRYQWVTPIGTGPTHFQPVTTSNGVVYTMDNIGTLTMIDASNGVPISRWPLSMDTGANATSASSQGVSVARNTIYAASAGFVVAYR